MSSTLSPLSGSSPIGLFAVTAAITGRLWCSAPSRNTDRHTGRTTDRNGLLDDRLGLRPEPETTAMYRALLAPRVA